MTRMGWVWKSVKVACVITVNLSLEYKWLRDRSLDREKTHPYQHRSTMVRSFSFVFQHCYGQNQARVAERNPKDLFLLGRDYCPPLSTEPTRQF